MRIACEGYVLEVRIALAGRVNGAQTGQTKESPQAVDVCPGEA